MNRTYGPGPLAFVATAVGAGSAVLSLLVPGHPLGLAAGFLIFLGSLVGWRWYRLDDEGIHRFGACFPLTVRWAEIGGVRGRTVERADRGGTAVTSEIVDPEGERLLRIGPWVARRKELARCIRKEIADHREHTDSTS